MNQKALDDIVAEVGRDLIVRMAPAELILYRAKSEAFFKDRPNNQDPAKQADEVLGLGVEETVAFLTPVVLAALYDVVTVLAGEITKQLGVEAGDQLRGAIRRLFGLTTPAAVKSLEPSRLNPDQLARVHAAAHAAVQRWRRSPEQAQQVADAIVASLAIEGDVTSDERTQTS